MRRLWVIGFVALHLVAAAASAQEFSFADSRDVIVQLNGPWRFLVGDDPRYADPSYDDSSWQIIDTTKPLSYLNSDGVQGFAWYRFRIQQPSQTNRPLALRLNIADNFEAFADGKRIGGCGPMSVARTALVFCDPKVIPLSSASRPGKPLLIALRVVLSEWPRRGGPRPGGNLIGDSGAVQIYQNESLESHKVGLTRDAIMIFVQAIGAVCAFALFLLRRSAREYLWLSLFLLVTVGERVSEYAELTHDFFLIAQFNLDHILHASGTVFLLLFFYALFKGRRSLLFYAAIASAVLNDVLQMISNDWPAILLAKTLQLLPVFAVSVVIGLAWLILLLLGRVRDGDIDARLLLLPITLIKLSEILDGLSVFARLRGDTKYLPNPAAYPVLNRPFPVPIETVLDLFFLGAIFTILVLRFARIRRQEEQHLNELEAARTVQRILIPEAVPEIPDFVIEAIYRPAQEVGGDFFQIIPAAEGSVLIVIGDVAGKGMQAAMTVSLLVGTLRTEAEHTSSPALLMQTLNRRSVGRGTGFTTCMILRASKNGEVVAANAGHLQPYLQGKELTVEAGLPLGFVAEMVYQETRFLLPAGGRLTLVTDGIVEAANARKELFGFERTLAVSGESASAIAERAEQFSVPAPQADDITVLSLMLAEEGAADVRV